MAKRNDQVFQLSLTELAFTIAFLLLLLLGYLFAKEHAELEAAKEAITKVQTLEKAAAALDSAKTQFEAALGAAGIGDVSDVISKLTAAGEAREERDRLKQRVDDLDAKLSALTELQRQIELADGPDIPELIREKLESALVFQEEVRQTLKEEEPKNEASIRSNKVTPSESGSNQRMLDRIKQAVAATRALEGQLRSELNIELTPGQEANAVRDVIRAAKNFQAVSASGVTIEQVGKENADLRGQLAFLKRRLEARGGRDYPPCWADEKTGKVEFLFTVELRLDSVSVSPAWPPNREADARALPGISELLAAPHSNAAFASGVRGIFGRSQQLECRHYVLLKSSISDAVQSDRARLMVENYFYKVEARR